MNKLPIIIYDYAYEVQTYSNSRGWMRAFRCVDMAEAEKIALHKIQYHYTVRIVKYGTCEVVKEY